MHTRGNCVFASIVLQVIGFQRLVTKISGKPIMQVMQVYAVLVLSGGDCLKGASRPSQTDSQKVTIVHTRHV